MRKLLAAVLAAVLLVALGALALGSGRSPASAASQYQHSNNPGLTLSVTDVTSSSYILHVLGSGYFSGSQPGGHVDLTCDKKASCGLPQPVWDPGPVNADGTFSLDVAQFECGSNVKFAEAFDVDGVKSNKVKGPC